MTKIPQGASLKTLAKLARRNDTIGAQARSRLQRLKPPKVGPALASLRQGLAKGKAIDPSSIPGLSRATPRGIKIAMKQAAKDAEKSRASKNEKRRRKYGEARVRAQTAAEKDREIAAIKKQLQARMAATPTHAEKDEARQSIAKRFDKEGKPVHRALMKGTEGKSKTVSIIKRVATQAAPHTPPRQEHGYHEKPPVIYSPKPAFVPTHIQRERDQEKLRKDQERDDAKEAAKSPAQKGIDKQANDAWDKYVRQRNKKSRVTRISAHRDEKGNWSVNGGNKPNWLRRMMGKVGG